MESHVGIQEPLLSYGFVKHITWLLYSNGHMEEVSDDSQNIMYGKALYENSRLIEIWGVIKVTL